MKSVEVKCEKCNGTGQVPLDPVLHDTFDIFQKGMHWTVEAAFETLLSSTDNVFTITAVNNRFEKLRSLGLLDRRRNGRAWEYFKKKGSK